MNKLIVSFLLSILISTSAYANKTIPDFTALSPVVTGSVFEISSGGTSYKVSIGDIFDFISAKGSLEITYNATAFNLTSAYTTYNINYVAGDSKYTTLSTSQGTINPAKSGTYYIVFKSGISKANSTDDIHGGISINGYDPEEGAEFTAEATMAGVNGIGCHYLGHLEAGVPISIKIKNNTANRAVTLTNGSLVMWRVGL